MYAEPQRVFPPSPDGPAEALSGAAGTAAANTLAELRAPDQLENGPVQPLIPASESEFSLEGTAAPKAPDLEPSALNEPASAPPPSHASSDPEVRQPDSEGSVPAANPGSCTPRDCASAPPLAPPTPAAHHSPPLGVASPSKNEDGVLQPLAKDGEGLDAVRKLVIRPDARHPANPEAGLLVPADETVAADENGARNEAVVADEGGVAEESLAACEDGEGVEHLAADESGAGGESRAAGGRQGGSKDAAAEESKAANGVEAHGATEISSDAGVESANPVQEALLLPAAEQDDILTSKEGIALGRELDVPTGIVPPSDRKQVSNPQVTITVHGGDGNACKHPCSSGSSVRRPCHHPIRSHQDASPPCAHQAAFEAALDVEIPDLKLEDIPAPGVPATAAEKRVEQANTLADKLLDDPQCVPWTGSGAEPACLPGCSLASLKSLHGCPGPPPQPCHPPAHLPTTENRCMSPSRPNRWRCGWPWRAECGPRYFLPRPCCSPTCSCMADAGARLRRPPPSPMLLLAGPSVPPPK